MQNIRVNICINELNIQGKYTPQVLTGGSGQQKKTIVNKLLTEISLPSIMKK